MYFGLYIPPFGDYADARLVSRLARDAEEAGWDGIFLWDHLVMSWPDPVVDPWVALTAIAMNTERIRFGTMVTPLTRRRPWVLARQTVSLDHLSGGRLILGVGLGYSPEPDFTGFGEVAGPRERGAMLDEALAVLTGLWRGEPFKYDGKCYHVAETLFLPAPLQTPRIPIWLSGLWPNKPPFRRAARWDGVFPLNAGSVETDMTPAQYVEMIEYIARHRTAASPFDIVHRGTTPGQDLAQDAAIVRPFAEAGVTWWLECIDPWRCGWRGSGRWPLEAMRERVRIGPPIV